MKYNHYLRSDFLIQTRTNNQEMRTFIIWDGNPLIAKNTEEVRTKGYCVAFPDTEMQAENLNKLIDGISNQKPVVVSIRSDAFIFHPYSTCFMKKQIHIIGKNETSNKILFISLSEIDTLGQVADDHKFKPISEAVFLNFIKSENMIQMSNTKQRVSNSSGIENTQSEMLNYWEEFNNEIKVFTVGERRQWYNEILNPYFISTEDGMKVYFEVCFQNGRETKLIINIIIQWTANGKEKAENFVNGKLKPSYKENNLKSKGLELQWDRRSGKNRRTIECCTKKLDENDLKNHKEHFKWFKSNLISLKETFHSLLSK